MADQPWEYKVDVMVNIELQHLGDRLNQLGADGWELVALAPRVKGIMAFGGDMVAVLKRPGVGAFDPERAKRMEPDLSGW